MARTPRSLPPAPIVENHLAALCDSRSLPAADLAAQVGVRRQTIYAIEAGSYLPNNELALRLASTLGVSIDQLFALKASARGAAPASAARRGDRVVPGASVHVCRVGDRWVSIPVGA